MLRVHRTKAQARASYDRMSGSYDLFAGAFEKRLRNLALARMDVAPGETALEIGCGTGHCLQQLAETVGPDGRVYGVDISPGMVAASRKRLARAGLLERVTLYRGDGAGLPLDDGQCDAAFMSFTLELFDTPEIPVVLGEIGRVLKPGGRLGVVSLAREEPLSTMVRVYEWLHQRLPRLIDCRPIYVEQVVAAAGFRIAHSEREGLWGLPARIVVGIARG